METQPVSSPFFLETIFAPQILSTPVLVALTVLKGYQESQKGRDIYIEDLSRYLITLENSGINISRIAISGSNGNYWSEDIAQFVSEGIVFGFLHHKSPLQFDDECKSICIDALTSRIAENEDIRPVIKKANLVLELDLDL